MCQKRKGDCCQHVMRTCASKKAARVPTVVHEGAHPPPYAGIGQDAAEKAQPLQTPCSAAYGGLSFIAAQKDCSNPENEGEGSQNDAHSSRDTHTLRLSATRQARNGREVSHGPGPCFSGTRRWIEVVMEPKKRPKRRIFSAWNRYQVTTRVQSIAGAPSDRSPRKQAREGRTRNFETCENLGGSRSCPWRREKGFRRADLEFPNARTQPSGGGTGRRRGRKAGAGGARVPGECDSRAPDACRKNLTLSGGPRPRVVLS